MKKLTTFLLFIVLSLATWAQTAKDEIYADLNRSASNYYAYPVPTVKQTPIPKGYKPFYLSHYARHGSRYQISSDSYEAPLNVLREANKNNVLTPQGKEVLKIVERLNEMSNGRLGELTPKGADQHRGIAARMFRNYPEVFAGNAHIDARSTIVIRCILSMTAECLQLQALNPKLQFKNDASSHDMYYMNYSDKKLKQMRTSDAITKEYKRLEKKFIHPERLMNELFNNQDYIKWKINRHQLMNQLFDMAGNMQSFYTDMDLFQYFTKEECYNLWLVNNWDWYVTHGPSPMTKGKMPYMEVNLLKNILDTADTCIVKKNNQATLRFGHEVCVMPLACLMELGDCGYATNESEKIAEKWRNYQIYPMASNIQLIFFRNTKNPQDVLVKVTLNEQEMTLPIKSDVAPYYHWKDFSTYYRNKLSAYENNK